MAGRGKDRKARSKAQERLATQLGEWFPFSRVRQEVYIGELIEARGYSIDEIAAELGHRPHRMFCDILLSDSEGDWAFEYHGEQHYHVIDGMTSTERVLAMNQHLDREKSWILERIGIPLVAVPYDAYIDAEVASRMMDEATSAVDMAIGELDECESCGRGFPSSMLVGGLCKCCRKEEEKRVRDEYEAQRKRGNAIADGDLPVDDDIPTDMSDPTDEEEMRGRLRHEDELRARQREEARARRKAAYREWKTSPEAQRQKEEQRAARRAAYQQRKEWMKEQRRKARERGEE